MFKLSITSAMFATLILGCDTPQEDVNKAREKLEDTKKEAREEVEKTALGESKKVVEAERELADAKAKAAREHYAYADRAKYRDAVRKDLDALDAEINELQAKADKETGEAKTALNKAAEDLRTRRKNLQVQLDRSNDVAEKEWDNFQKEVEEGFGKLREDVKLALNRLEKKI